VNFEVIGKGSNIIVSDNGFDGVIILFGKDFSEIKVVSDNILECQSGAALKKVCCVALENNMSGLEFAWGIPGTIGGALYMNAGAYGGEMKDVVLYAEYVNEKGELVRVDKKDMDLAYRHSIFSDNRNMLIVKVVLQLVKNDYNKIKLKMDELLQKRIDKQPLNFPSAGSTFKRPEGNYASYLIEKCGLKGLSVGDAQVSEKHSGFIINKGNATCEDIMKLVSLVQEKVKDDTGYELELEPRIIK
jgi:UDP-N-acetylmuramate dehydrogenase